MRQSQTAAHEGVQLQDYKGMIIIYSYIPSISRSSFSLLPTPSLVALLPVMLHIEEKRRHYLVHVINVPNVQLHTVLVSYLFDDSPKTLQSRKSCPIQLMFVSIKSCVVGQFTEISYYI